MAIDVLTAELLQEHIDRGLIQTIRGIEHRYALPSLNWSVNHVVSAFELVGRCSASSPVSECECSAWASTLELVRYGDDGPDLAVSWFLPDSRWPFQISHRGKPGGVGTRA